MKKLLAPLFFGAAVALSPVAFAQDAPPPPPPQQNDQQPPPPPRENGQGWDQRPDGMRGMGRGMRQDHGMRDDRMGDHNRGPQMPPDIMKMRAYLSIVQQFSQMVQNPDTVRVAALMAATDTFRPRGHTAVIDYLNGLLTKLQQSPNDSPVIERAIRIQLGQEYRASGQSDKALEQFQSIILGTNQQAEAPKK